MKLKLEDIAIDYEEIGEGKTVILLGISPMKETMEPIFNQMKGYKRIYINPPGFGETKVENWIKSTDDVLDVVIKAIKNLVSHEMFSIVGWSYTGYLARGVISKLKGQITSALLICPVVVGDSKKRNLPKNLSIIKDDDFISGLNEQDSQAIKSLVIQNKETLKNFKEMFAEFKYMDSDFYNSIKEKGKYEYSFDINEITQPFDSPTLVILGRQDTIVGYKDALELVDYYTNGSFVLLAQGGHNLQAEQKEVFTTLVKKWLGEI